MKERPIRERILAFARAKGLTHSDDDIMNMRMIDFCAHIVEKDFEREHQIFTDRVMHDCKLETNK